MAQFAVECVRDPERGEIPVRFGSHDAMREVVELMDRWEGDAETYYRVRTDDTSIYILRQDRANGGWQIHFFRSGGED